MKKVFSFLWIGLTIIVNTLALSGLLYHVGLANTVWRGPLAKLGQAYLGLIDRLFAPLDALSNAVFGWVAPFWVLHLIVAYLTIASALMVWSWLRQKPKNKRERLKSAGKALAWAGALPRALINSLKGQIPGRAVLGYIMALLATYGVSRSFNANLVANDTTVEALYFDDYCAQKLNKYHRARPFLQDNFDKAVAVQNWKQAERSAHAMVDLTNCLGGQGHGGKIDTARHYLNFEDRFYTPEQVRIDLARMQLDTGDAFYESEQWQLARELYGNGLSAFDHVVQTRLDPKQQPIYAADTFEYYLSTLPSTHQDIDLAVLFNLEALFRQRLNMLTATRNMLEDENAQAFHLGDIYSSINRWNRLKSDFRSDISEETRDELAERFREDSAVTLPGLMNDLVLAAKIESDTGQQINAALAMQELVRQHKDAIFFNTDQFQVVGDLPPTELSDQWVDIGESVNDIYQDQIGRGENSIAPIQLMINHILEKNIAVPMIHNAASSDTPLTDIKKNELRKVWVYSTRFIDTYEAMLPETRNAVLSMPVLTDPYPNYIKIANLLDEKERAYEAMQKQLYHVFDNALVGSNAYNFSAAPDFSRLTLLTTNVLAKDQELDQKEIYNILNDATLPDTHAVKKRWGELTDRLCLNLKRRNWDFGDQSCPDYIRDLLFLPRGQYDSPSSLIEAAKYNQYSPPESIDIDLLFGTTRAYKPDSKIAEKRFTRKDEPNGHGRRGSVTLSAPLNKLGPPLLATALTKGKERADIFNFVGMPEVFGYGPKAEARFREELVKRLENADHGETFIFVHGVGNTFASAAKRTAQLSYDLQFPGVAMFYTWPTESNFLGYFKDVNVPQMAIDDLASFIDDANESSSKVHIIAHSHGARVTVDALKELIKNRDADAKDLNFGQIILAAPDVNGKKLKSAVDKYVSSASDRVTIYTNNSDGALWASSLLRFFKWRGGLGKSGDTCSAQLIDASSAVPFGSHGYFAKESEVLADLRTLIWHSGIAPAQRCYLQEATEGSTARYKFTKDKCDITAFDLASQVSIKGRQTAVADFDLIYADLVSQNKVEGAEKQMNKFNPDDWKMINPSDGTIGSRPTVVVGRKRYDAAVDVHKTLEAAGANTNRASCAP